MAMTLEDRARNKNFDLSQEQQNISRNLWDQWAQHDLPFQANTLRRADQLGSILLGNVRDFASPARLAREAGMAASTAGRVWDREKQGLMRTLGRYGLQPGRFGQTLRALSLGKAANVAGAQNEARSRILDQDIGQKMGLFNMFRGAQVTNPAQVLGGLQGAQGGLASISGQLMQERMANVASDSQKKAGLWGALGQLGGSAITAWALMSDRRSKKDIERIGVLPDVNVGLYEFRYKDDPDQTLCVGVMADELEAVRPHLVHERDDGYQMVDYGGLIDELTRKAA